MKIRGDFVTNSSSVSYILTANEDIINNGIQMWNHKGTGELLTFLKQEMENKGGKIDINGKQFYYLKIDFHTEDSIEMDEDAYKDVWFKYDFSKLSDDEIWGLVYWTILNGRIQNLHGIGVTQLRTN